MKLKELAKQAGLKLNGVLLPSEGYCTICIPIRETKYADILEIKPIYTASTKKQARAFLRGYIAAQEKAKQAKPEAEKKGDERIIAHAGKLNIEAKYSRTTERWALSPSKGKWIWDITQDEAWGFLWGYKQAREDTQRERETS